jgi:hypothetical protein
MKKAMLLIPLMGMLSGCISDVPAPTAAAWAEHAGEVHRMGQNEYVFKSTTNGPDTAQSYCKAIGLGFANVLRTGAGDFLHADIGGDETAFQCFPDGARLVPMYPKAGSANINIWNRGG